MMRRPVSVSSAVSTDLDPTWDANKPRGVGLLLQDSEGAILLIVRECCAVCGKVRFSCGTRSVPHPTMRPCVVFELSALRYRGVDPHALNAVRIRHRARPRVHHDA